MKKVFTTAFIAMLSLSAFAQTKADTLVVTIVYDGRKTTYADYESAFKKIGYSVKKVKM